jgi:FAD/FMN-containing dehydrogenase/Fe-S oxidoreductase
MDINRQRVHDDLRGLVQGEVLADPVLLQLYATDASLHQVTPAVVVRPHSTADCVATVLYAAENKLPLHPRGAGSGLAGESLGPGIVIDCSRYLRRILEFDGSQVVVQPGVVHSQLNYFLGLRDMQFGPDPATSQVTTMGGVAAVDSGGSHWLKHGSARRHVKRMQIVLADGTLLDVGLEAPRDDLTGEPTRRDDLLFRLSQCLNRNADVISQNQPRAVVNRCGYQLADVAMGDSLDLPKLLTGSAGTLALITQLTLDVVPLPKHRGVALVFFERLENAARAVMEVLPYQPSACDLMDRRHLNFARESAVAFDLLIPPETEGALLIEFEGETPAEVRDFLAQAVDRVYRRKRYAFAASIAQDRTETDLYWQLAQGITPTMQRFKASTRPLPFVEDFAVPPRELAPFLTRMQNVLKQHQVTASLFAHAGQGQLHLRPFLDPENPADVARMTPLAHDLYREVIDAGGTISGEHGDGFSRTDFIAMQYGPLTNVFAQVKRIFDPDNLFNPGKVVPVESGLLGRYLRPALDDAPNTAAVEKSVGEPSVPPTTNGEAAIDTAAPMIDLQLAWSREDLVANVRDCNGCGTCRTQTAGVRMCPIFRYAPAEEASPRAKANLMRGILTGELDPATMAQDTFKQVADLCVHCHMCRQECPSGVDIPHLMMEGKGQFVQTNGLTFHESSMAQIDRLSWLGHLLGPVANWAIGYPPARWLLEKITGISQSRKLPRFASRSFLREAARKKLTRTTRRGAGKVLYFVDTFANYHDPQLAFALVKVLQHNGIDVYVHPAQKASSMSMMALGALTPARKQAHHNVTILAEAVRQGYNVVTTEPSAALALKQEYPFLLGDEDSQLVAEHAADASSFLWQLHRQGKLRLDLRPMSITVGYHQPCHLRALNVGSPTENLLRLIPGLQVQRLEAGCSGMAGTFGLQRKNFRTSLKVGRPLTRALRDPAIHAGTTDCSACRLQMEQVANKPTLHPIKLLAFAYQLMPELASELTARREELVL